MRRFPAWSCVPLLALLLVACGGGGHSEPPPDPDPPLVTGEVPPAFQLPDVNPGSASFGAQVGPAGSVGKASAWYFGWAT
jgi:hypothetical protein